MISFIATSFVFDSLPKAIVFAWESNLINLPDREVPFFKDTFVLSGMNTGITGDLSPVAGR
ncbi:hypothetical protein PN472_03355 [Microcystis aeruginosa CS-1036]|nr:hypothetical protein [Microcystis aeruginosa CS-1036]